jgi:hypothetical protein
MWYSNLEKTFISQHILHQYWYICPIALPLRRNRGLEVFSLVSQPLPRMVGHHLRLSNILERISRPSYEPLYATNTSHRKQETFLYEYPFIESLCPQKSHKRTLLFRITLQARSPFWLLKPASELAHARLLPRLSWSWTVLLPSDTHRKPITSITAVLLPFVTYLLALPRIYSAPESLYRA